MKRIIPICLSISIIFMLLFTTGGYAESDRPSNNNDIHVVEEMVSDVRKIDDASQFVKSADPNRIYYSAEKTATFYEGPNPIYTLTGRYIWSVDSNNPTVDTLAFENMVVLRSDCYISTLNGVTVTKVFGGNNGMYISGYIKASFNAELRGYTLMQTINAFPDGYYNIYESGGTVSRST